MSKQDIIKYFQNNIIENESINIKYSYTKVNDLYVLHIYNPSSESIKIDNKSDFYKKLSNILFDKNKKTKKSCFNYEHMEDDDPLYNYNDEEIINRFLSITYSFILIDINFDPISILAISSNTIYNVCTDLNKRGKNYMTLLFSHVLKLIQYDKLKIKINYNELKLNVRKINPFKEKLIEFYKKFNFTNIDYDNGIYITMYME